MSLHISNVTLNMQDLEKGKNFWAAALGYEVLEETEDWVGLGDPDKRWVRLGLQKTDRPKTEPIRMHLDLSPEDGPAEVERLKSLGATIPPWTYNSAPDYLVMRDPEGNEFCVNDRGNLEVYRVRI